MTIRVSGIGWRRALWNVATMTTAYCGVLAVLWGLGFVVRGWYGALIVLTPLFALIGVRVYAWRRVSAELSADRLSYEGISPSHDFDVPLSSARAFYFDEAPETRALIVVLAQDDERALSDLSRSASRRIARALHAAGVRTTLTPLDLEL